MSNRIWTHTARVVLFEATVAKFGPRAEWEMSVTQVLATAEFKAIAAAMVALIGCEPGGAEGQMAWALTKQKSVSLGSHVANLMGNKVAAYEAGLLSFGEAFGYLPSVKIENDNA